LGSEDDDLDAFRRSKNPSLKPRFHVMLVGGTSRCARCARRAVLPFVLPLSALQDGASVGLHCACLNTLRLHSFAAPCAQPAVLPLLGWLCSRRQRMTLSSETVPCSSALTGLRW
jgi:hypothetical protein